MTGATRWWWLRHAPVPCPTGRITGRLDLPCDTSDTADFQSLAQRLPPRPLLVESGLIRCRQTVGALEACGLMFPEPVVEPDLAEQDFGRWQGLSWTALTDAKDPDLPAFWRSPGTATPPAGESFAHVVDRVARVVRRLSAAHPDRDILAVAHAGTIRAALALALDLTPDAALRLVVDPLSLTRIDAVEDGWRVATVNWAP